MVEEEIHAFLEVHGAFRSLENLVNTNLQAQKELRRDIEDVSSSPKMIYGVVKKTTKEEKLAKLRDRLTKTDIDCEISNELFSIVSGYLLETEIPNFKVNHTQKWNFLLNSLAEERLKKLKNEHEFWEKLAKQTNTKI